MSTPHEDFDAQGTSGTSSCSFTLGGRKWNCRNQDDIPFEAIRSLTVPSGDAKEAVLAVEPFFQSMLMPDEIDDFLELLHAPGSPLTLGRLEPVMKYVAEHALNRPTKPPNRSRPGRQSTGRTSGGGSSSAATRRKQSGK